MRFFTWFRDMVSVLSFSPEPPSSRGIHDEAFSANVTNCVFLQQSMISKSPLMGRRATLILQKSALPWRPRTRPWLLPMPSLILGSPRQVT